MVHYCMRKLLTGLVAAWLAVLLVYGVVGAAQGGNESVNTTVTDVLSKAMANPKVAVSMLIQFLLGLALGYYSAKIAKYLLAWIGVIIIGALLSVWSLGGSVDDILTKLGLEAKKLMPIIRDFLTALGVLTVGPVAVGFVLGLIIGVTRK